MAASSCGGRITLCGTKLYCRVCDLALDPIPAKQHFLGRRHEQACLDEVDMHFVCFECGTWCSSHNNLHQHLSGYSHRMRLEWLGRSVTPGVPCACGHDAPMRPASPAASSAGGSRRAMSSDLPEAVAPAPAADAQRAPPLPALDEGPQQTGLPGATLLRCRICDWTGSKAAAWDHFQSDAHRWTVVQLPTARDGKVACGDCGIWCPNLDNLMNAHLPSARHQQRRRWLAGPPPALSSPDEPAPIEMLLPTMMLARPSVGRHLDGDGAAHRDSRMCIPSAPELLAELEQLLLCPISHEVVVDPVAIQDGSSYERSSIQKWFLHNSTSPMTGLAVDTRVVVPNSMVRTVAALFHRHKGSTAS